MKALLVEGSGMESAILLMLFLAFGVPIILFIIGLSLRNSNKSASKKVFIGAVVYILISLGVCGGLMM